MNPVVLEDVEIEIGGIRLDGILEVPQGARGIVLFAHGSGSSRLSPRNRAVAHALQRQQLGTLLFDLLTPQEDADDLRFAITLLAERLVGASRWVQEHATTRLLQQGFFGASTGAAAALIAAAELGKKVKSVVSRGGRPDLAGPYLPKVQSPTLLIVGGNDFGVIELNKSAFEALHCEKELAIVPNATHLFEEAGALEHVSRLASDWFLKHFTAI